MYRKIEFSKVTFKLPLPASALAILLASYLFFNIRIYSGYGTNLFKVERCVGAGRKVNVFTLLSNIKISI